MYNYGIGGQEVPKDASEAIADIPQNRTLLIEKLTSETPIKPEIVEGLKTVEEVFEYFKPQITSTFEKQDGFSVNEILNFSNLGDFGAKGITNQSKFLHELQLEKNEYFKLIKQLKSSKLLKLIIESSDTKQALIDSLQALVHEIEYTN